MAEHVYPAGLRQPRHAHEATTVTLVIAGSLRESVGRVEEIARPLSAVVKPRDTEHADQFGASGARTLQIILDADTAVAAERWERGIGRWRWSHGGPAIPTFLRLLQTTRMIGRVPGNDARIDEAALDVLAALANDTLGGTPTGSPPAWLGLIRQGLDDGLAPTVRALAARVGVHPVYLARRFRHWYGCSITDYVARRRVQRAAGRIASTSHRLSTISYDLGFADQAHMCRIFRRHTGLAPSAFRQLAANEA